MKYIIESKESIFHEYLILMVESFSRDSEHGIDWAFSVTNDKDDATKFLWIDEAYDIISELNLEEGWEVVPLEEK